MKFFLLTTATFIATAAHAQEYATLIHGSEQVTEIDFVDAGARLRCTGPVGDPCPSSEIPYTCESDKTNMCCKWTNLVDTDLKSVERLRELLTEIELPGYGKCSPVDVLAASSEDASFEEDLNAADKVPQFLRGITLEGNKCSCNKDKDCYNGDKCHASNCSKHNGYSGGHCKSSGNKNKDKCYCNKDHDCKSGEYCHASDCSKHNGYSGGKCKNNGNNNKGKCYCNKDHDCKSGQYCHSTSCSKHNGYSGGLCKSSGSNNKNLKSCNYKQCTHKSNGDCSCNSNQYCVKGSGYSCTKRNNDNGCCVNSEVAEGYFLG